MAPLVIGAMGIVYGDIGTSPLYTLRTAFTGAHALPLTHENVLGILSALFWSLMIVVTLKYVSLIMRADNRGEGGILALTALVARGLENNPRRRWWLVGFGIFGAAMFYGDGMITPAITVLGAVEGLQVIAPSFHAWVVPIAVVIMLVLFGIQKRGTATIGAMFGPVMCIWFATLAVLGVLEIATRPAVIAALNPIYAIGFFASDPGAAFLAMGAVVLVVTGTEALYADMGHFGRTPIRRAWLFFVMPALLLNYFGQGALVLNDPSAIKNPFYLLAPDWALVPLLVLATAAAIIASQAVVSGAFSLTRAAIQMGYCPRLTIEHTSERAIGQIYVPFINWTLLAAVIALVIGSMAAVDAVFFASNAMKFLSGGWFPLLIGITVFTLLMTWKRGRLLMFRRLIEQGIPLKPFLEGLDAHPPTKVPGTAIFMTSNPDTVPHALLHNLKHNKVLHEQTVFLTIVSHDVPVVPPEDRVQLERLVNGFYQLQAWYGFKEQPDIDEILNACRVRYGLGFDVMDTSFFLSRETVIPTSDTPGMALWRDHLFAWMTRNATRATDFFNIPANRVVELGTHIEI